MEHALRRRIEELLTLYDLEPTLRDLYVEGPHDKRVFDWFLGITGCRQVTIFDIDTVDIGSKILERLKLKSGNRGLVIALAILLEQSLEGDVKYVRCIADSDFDFVLGFKHNSEYLLYTDYTSLDLYFFDLPAIEKYLKLGVKRMPRSGKDIYANFSNVLREIFFIRAANEKLGWHLKWLSFKRYLRLDQNLVRFDGQKFIHNYLTNNGRGTDISKFERTVGQLRGVRVQNVRCCIGGHDIFELLGWYVSKITKKSSSRFRDPLVVQSMLCCAVDVSSLQKEQLFGQLLRLYK